MRFADIPADPAIKEKLVRTVLDQRVSHAQLFFGPEGTGKLALAIAYAQLINCPSPNPLPKWGGGQGGGVAGEGVGGGADSCGTCPSCIQYQKLAHPDLHFFFPVATTKKVPSKPSSRSYIDAWRKFLQEHDTQVSLPEWYDFIGIENKQGTIYTDDAGEINRILSYKSYESEYKVVILWMIEKLTHAAAPKLLKILEEPPDKTLFLLISDNPDHVIPTILSRCLPVRVPRIPETDIRNWLVRRTGCSLQAAQAAARASDGNIRTALIRLQTEEEDRFLFDTFRKWMLSCFSGNVPEMIGFAAEAGKIGREKQKSLLNYGLQVAGLSPLIRYGIPHFNPGGENETTFVEKFSPYLTRERLPAFYDLLNSAVFHIERNAHAPTLFLDLSLKVSALIRGN